MSSVEAWREGLDNEGPSSLQTRTARPFTAPGELVSLWDPGEASPEAVALARELGVTITAADILHRAGRGPGEETQRFLDPRLLHLTPPDAMADREASSERIARAVRAGERICVFGDYDCDGITAAAIMTSVLRSLGGAVVPLLATRM